MKYTVISFDELSRLDSTSVAIFREKLAQVNTDKDPVLIDLTGIDFIDSSGLGAIIAAVNSTRGETRLFLCGVKENVRRIMELARVYTILPLYSSVSAVIEMLQQESREFKNAA